jgi:predicted CopG family antitoxin
MKNHEKVYKKLLELRRNKKSLSRLLGHVSGPAETEVNEGYNKAIHQVEILEWILDERDT